MDNEPKGKPDSSANMQTRRQALATLGVLAGVVAAPRLLRAQQSTPERSYRDKEAPWREIRLYQDAERKREEWGIRISGNQISGPSSFLFSFNSLNQTSKAFSGICLADAVRQVDIRYFPPYPSNTAGPEYDVESLGFDFIDEHGHKEHLTFSRAVQRGSSTRVETYYVTEDARLFTEGSCGVPTS